MRNVVNKPEVVNVAMRMLSENHEEWLRLKNRANYVAGQLNQINGVSSVKPQWLPDRGLTFFVRLSAGGQYEVSASGGLLGYNLNL